MISTQTLWLHVGRAARAMLLEEAPSLSYKLPAPTWADEECLRRPKTVDLALSNSFRDCWHLRAWRRYWVNDDMYG